MCVYCVKCTKFGKLFLRKVIKTVATRCLDFSSKRPKMRLAAGLPQRLSAPPDPLAAKRGPTSKGRGGKRGEGRDGRGEEGRGRKVGREGIPPYHEILDPPLVTVMYILENRIKTELYYDG